MSEGFRKQDPGFATRAVHVGCSPEKWSSGALVPPIVMSSNFKQDAPGVNKGFFYGRVANPTRSVLEECLASLDEGRFALTFSTGMAATTVITHLLKTGEHILAGDDLYGGNYRYIYQICKDMGISHTFVDTTDLARVREQIRDNTRMVWLETPTNPTLSVTDIRALSDMVHAVNKDIVVVVDNTFLTSYFQRPLTLGADISMYSMTKYMNGHGDVIMGAAVVNCEKLHERLRFLLKMLGPVPSPFDCYLALRGLKTLPIRMEQHMRNGLIIARFLEKHPRVAKVLHPGEWVLHPEVAALDSHPHRALARRQAYGHSGMLSFYLKGNLEDSKAFIKALKTFTLAGSLGGFDSLVAIPTLMTHESIPPKERERLGITDNLIRVSVGLEDTNDLIADLDQALRSTAPRTSKM